ncbi:MAG: D-2-hydroxyacid dehydrogenase [Dehalococcoidia bacterium]
MEKQLQVTLTLPLAENLQERLRSVDPRVRLTALSQAQRRQFRGGRPLWVGYTEHPVAEAESDEEARRKLDAALAGTEVLLSSSVLIPEDILTRAPGLRWIQLTSAGVDRMLDNPLLRAGVTVTTVSGIHAVPIGEYVLGAMLAFAKGLPRAARAQAERRWQPYPAEELLGKTVGIIGLGAIGGKVAELARALGMRVLAVRRTAKARETGVSGVDELMPAAELPYLLSESDYVVVSVPLTPESRGMIGERELRSMRPSAVIINIARGAIIDEAALVRALKESWLAGAALDVFEQEPLPAESELWGLENVIVTPHVSGGTPRYMELAMGVFSENLRRYLAGEPLRNVVDVERGY